MCKLYNGKRKEMRNILCIILISAVIFSCERKTATQKKWKKMILKTYEIEVPDDFIIRENTKHEGYIGNDSIQLNYSEGYMSEELTEELKSQNVHIINDTIDNFIISRLFSDSLGSFGYIIKKRGTETRLFGDVRYSGFSLFAEKFEIKDSLILKRIINSVQIINKEQKAVNI